MAECRIVVLNYNGRGLMEKCLPSIVRAAAKSRHACKVTVLDNLSSDDSESWVREHFPQVEFVRSSANRVFCSYNEYARKITEEFMTLLNNDIKVDENFVDALLSPLAADPKIFFTAPKTLNFVTGEYEGGLSKLEMRFGLPWGSARFPGYEKCVDVPGLTMQTGFGVFRRKIFLDLGGFDDLYLPGTVEDADLCFRAYRAGFTGLYCPQSVVYHMGQASFKKAFGLSGIRRINRRNLFLFVWKNIRDMRILARHFLWIGVHCLKYAVKGEFDFLCGVWDALARAPLALQKRALARKEKSVISDRQIFDLSEKL